MDIFYKKILNFEFIRGDQRAEIVSGQEPTSSAAISDGQPDKVIVVESCAVTVRRSDRIKNKEEQRALDKVQLEEIKQRESDQLAIKQKESDQLAIDQKEINQKESDQMKKKRRRSSEDEQPCSSNDLEPDQICPTCGTDLEETDSPDPLEYHHCVCTEIDGRLFKMYDVYEEEDDKENRDQDLDQEEMAKALALVVKNKQQKKQRQSGRKNLKTGSVRQVGKSKKSTPKGATPRGATPKRGR